MKDTTQTNTRDRRLFHSDCENDSIQSLERDYNHYYFIMRGMVYYNEYD